MNGDSTQNVQNEALLEALKKEVLRKVLTKEAMERLGRVKMVNPVLAMQVENYLVQAYQSGKLRDVIDDAALKRLLEMLTRKRESKIRFVRK